MARFISIVVPDTAGVSTLNRRVSATATNPTPTSSGGNITTSNDYKIHTFTSSGTFTLVAGANVSIEYLCVAGGGGGKSPSTAIGGHTGAGGGAGGFLTWYSTAVNGNDCIGPRFILNTGDYITITIGGGGAGSAAGGSGNGSGGNTTISIYNAAGQLLNSLLSYGGSLGGSAATYNTSPGGSGGGATSTTSYNYDIARFGPPRQGYKGATGTEGSTGGGGAGGAGSGANGGPGKTDVITGLTYSQGGQAQNGAVNQSAEAANTGNGGDASSDKNKTSGAGGSGIVVIRYKFQ